MSNSVFILGAARTAIGSFQGALSTIAAPRLGAVAIQGAIKQSQIKENQIEECIMGQVLSAGSEQAPARQAAIYAGIPSAVPCTTINKVCGSGLKAVMLAADSISLNQTQVAVAGGQENMTQSPHLLMNSRGGYRMGHVQMYDSMIRDGLWDPYSNFHMGNAAEICANEYKLSRKEQDDFSIESYQLALKAQKESLFNKEIVGVEIKNKQGSQIFQVDEEPAKVKFDKISELKAAFEKDGTITAANASKINDGAAAVVLANSNKVKELNLKPLARIVSYASYAQDPKWFTTAPVGAIKKTLEKAQLKVENIDLWEVNEAFSIVTLVAMKEFKIPRSQINIHGGAVALGHPLGASGARVLTTLVHALYTYKKQYGLASLCIGGGEAVAMIIERIES